MSDIEIAQSVKGLPIKEIAKTAGIDDKYLIQYGNDKAKVELSLLKESTRPDCAMSSRFPILSGIFSSISVKRGRTKSPAIQPRKKSTDKIIERVVDSFFEIFSITILLINSDFCF